MSEHDPDNSDSTDPEALYRALSDESPPSAIDQAILSHAAQRPVRSQRSWQTIGRRFATAAVVVLAVGIYLQTDLSNEAELARETAPALEKSPPQPAVSSPPSEPALKRAKSTPAQPEPEPLLSSKTPAPALADATSNDRLGGALYATESAQKMAAEDDQSQEIGALVPQARSLEKISGGMFKETRVEKVSHDDAIFRLESCAQDTACSHRLRLLDEQASCQDPYEIPRQASDLASEDDVFTYTFKGETMSVRCMNGKWLVQRKLLQTQPDRR